MTPSHRRWLKTPKGRAYVARRRKTWYERYGTIYYREYYRRRRHPEG